MKKKKRRVSEEKAISFFAFFSSEALSASAPAGGRPGRPPSAGASAPAEGGRPGLPPAGAVRQREAEKQKEDEERATHLKAREAAGRGGTGRKTEKTQRW